MKLPSNVIIQTPAGTWTFVGRVGCQSNDHSNGDRDYTTPHAHQDGGYALRHRWI